MGRDQETADLLFEALPNDIEKIVSEEKEHGACLRLNKGKTVNEWIFTDGFSLKTQIELSQ